MAPIDKHRGISFDEVWAPRIGIRAAILMRRIRIVSRAVVFLLLAEVIVIALAGFGVVHKSAAVMAVIFTLVYGVLGCLGALMVAATRARRMILVELGVPDASRKAGLNWGLPPREDARFRAWCESYGVDTTTGFSR